MTPDRLARLVLDAGPLIAGSHSRDPEHRVAAAGLRQLARGRTRLLAPLPIVFDVYKWLAYNGGGNAARVALDWMRAGLEIIYLKPSDLDEIVAILASMPTWNGSLEDALVAVLGLRLDVPVWTLNCRDLAAFQNLHCWTPAPS